MQALYRIKAVDPVSLGKMGAILFLSANLPFMVLYMIVFGVSSVVNGTFALDVLLPMVGALISVGSSSVIGFVLGVVGALLYNSVNPHMGTLSIRLGLK